MVALLVAGFPDTSSAYLKIGTDTGSGSEALHWDESPVRYYVNELDGPDVPVLVFQEAIGRAFDAWQAVATATITYQLAGLTAARPGQADGLSTLGFLSRPQLQRVLAATSFVVDNDTGELLESDIFFNSTFDWSASDAGEAGHFDLESVAVHEVGHMSGLGHSAIGETELIASGGRRVLGTHAVMFPIAFPAGNTSNRTLRPDDIAGLSDIYPEESFRQSTGSISGRVTKNNSGMFGAHVTAFNPATGALISNFALDSQGRFSIAGLPPGAYIVRVEPLDDADIDGFFDSSIPIDLNFRVTFHPRLVAVPRGGDSGAIQIRVVGK
jgi:hypothetical protein